MIFGGHDHNPNMWLCSIDQHSSGPKFVALNQWMGVSCRSIMIIPSDMCIADKENSIGIRTDDDIV